MIHPPNGRALRKRAALVVLLALLTVGVRSAGSEPSPTLETLADRVEAAFAADDTKALTSLAALMQPSPWDVVVVLARRDAHDAAAAYAGVATTPDLTGLSAYVVHLRDHPIDPQVVTLRSRLRGHVQTGAWKEVIGAAAAIEALTDPLHRAVCHLYLAIAHRNLRHADAALAAYGESADVATRLEHLALGAHALRERAKVARGLRRFDVTIDTYTELARLEERRGRELDAARARANLGTTYYLVGDSRQALRAHRAAARVYAARGATRSLGKSLHNAGLAYFQLGEYPAAIETLERALAAKRNPDPRIRDPLGECRSLQTLGQVYTRLGDVQRAESLLEAAEKLLADGGPPAERVRTIASLASAYERDEDYESAEKAYEASLAIELDERHAWLRERIRAALASVYVRQERFAEAEAVLRPALERLEALADRDGAAHAMVTLAVALSRSGRPEAALTQLAEARARAEELDDTRLVSETWAAESWARHRQGQNVRAMEAATEAIVTSRRILTGLAAAQSATIRARHLTPFQVGMEAAADENAAARFVSFLESGRAGALLEGLEARDELMRAGVPAPLRERLDRARSAEALARHAYLDAVRTNADRRTRGKLARAHHALRAKTLLAVEAIQRDRKAQVAADLLYPQPATLEAIQQVLDDGDAMILYGFAEKRIYAVVVTRQGADIHALGARRPIEEACAALRFDEATIDPLPAMSALRKQLVDPLGLKQQIQRVLISPAGCLHRLPFRIWFPDRTLVHIPSATTYRLLRNQDEQPGEGVLALADPAYEAHRGHARLEGSGAEARAITDDVFLREAATESRLRAALAARGDKRLRALHLAAHGRLDRRRPLQAHIALAADEHNDGDLTALEVFEMRIPADLVVASACYTGAGAVYEGEGLIGFTRAFMYAGAPRVLVSLWAVPDDATRALMIEFYRRWRPRDGRPARSAAEALRDAQAHIRAQPKWRHPMHWAAWVLWGRAD